MKFLFLYLVFACLTAKILASHQDDSRHSRVIREADDDEAEPTEEELAEIQAALARKAKIARPEYAPPPKFAKGNGTSTANVTTTTEPSMTRRTVLTTRAPKTTTSQSVAQQGKTESRNYRIGSNGPVAIDVSVPAPAPVSSRRSNGKTRYVSGTKGGSRRASSRKGGSASKPSSPSKVLLTQKRPTSASAGSGSKGGAAADSSKGGGVSEWKTNLQPLSYSPIAKGKSMYRLRPQVPLVVAPVPASELLVPLAPEYQSYSRRPSVGSVPHPPSTPTAATTNYHQEAGPVYSIVAPLKVPLSVAEEQFLGNSYAEKGYAQPQVVLAPLPVESAALAAPTPIARGSRPRGGGGSASGGVSARKSKYNSNAYPRSDLSPAYRSKALLRAEVSEDPYEGCPYGMRLSACRQGLVFIRR